MKTSPWLRPVFRYRCIAMCVLVLSSGAILLQAQKTWNGSTSADWIVAANWTPIGVPTSAENVTISALATAPVIKSGIVAVARSVRILSGALLSIDNGGLLTVDGSAVRGVWNDGTLNNSGSIVVDNTATDGLFNGATGTISNFGSIGIGANGGISSIGLNGFFNIGNVNNNGGSMTVNRTGNGGFVNLGSGAYTGSNGASMDIGLLGGIGNISQPAIVNQGSIVNDASTISVSNTPRIGLSNFGTVTNQNGANITVGSTGFVGREGINSSGTFVNSGANISIDRTGDDGLLSFGSFTNTAGGNIAIGQSGGTVAQNGIVSNNSFTNDGSTIVIDNVGLHGIANSGSAAQFINQNDGTITVGENGTIGQHAISNFFANNFTNGTCSNIELFDNIFHQNSGFVNNGLLIVSTTQISTILGGGFINDGVIQDTEGSMPIGDMTNHEVIVQPVSGPICPGVFNPVLHVAGSGFVIDEDWFADLALTQFAGSYSSATNTFLQSGLVAGSHILYFEVTGTCTFLVSMGITILDETPTEICNGIDDDCDGEIDETDLTVVLPICRTVYPGYAPASEAMISAEVIGGMPPYTFLWSPGGETSQDVDVHPVVTTDYTVSVTDHHGCVATATIVVEAVDVSCTNNQKVIICHNGKDKCVNINDVGDHFAHGDLLGPCGISVCEVYPPTEESIAVWPGGGQIQYNTPESQKPAVVIYPNPATSVLYIQLPEEAIGVIVKLWDLQGACVRTYPEIGEQPLEIGLEGIRSGMYLVQVISGEQMLPVQKVMIESNVGYSIERSEF